MTSDPTKRDLNEDAADVVARSTAERDELPADLEAAWASWSKRIQGCDERTGLDADTFMQDLARRVDTRPQITTDALASYRWAIYSAFNGNVDHATVHKTYKATYSDKGRYSPPVCTGCTKQVQHGAPDLEKASTSHVERQNLSVRMGSRRFTRLSNGFSKRLENHTWAVHLHYWHFNFARKHLTLKTTPAVAAGIASKPMTMLDLVRMVEEAEALNGGRLTDYLPACTSK